MTDRWRQGNRWDAVINGVNYRLRRDEGVYRKVVGRSQLQIQQMLNQAGNQYTSRDDLRTLFQTDWSGGSQWQKPLLSEQSIDTYYNSQGFDMTTEPGNIIPTPDILVTTTLFDYLQVPGHVQVDSGTIYWDDDGSVTYWNGSSAATLTNTFTDDPKYGMCWDSSTSTIFGLSSTHVSYVTPDSAGGTVLVHGEAIATGANIFMHFGRLIMWTGYKLIEIADPLGTPAATTIWTDGMGQDLIGRVDSETQGALLPEGLPKLAIATSEGIFVVRNVSQNGQVTAFVTRIDRTNDGTNVGVPIATLPPGKMVVNITYHLGSLVFAATGDMVRLWLDDPADEGYPEITLYHLTNDSLGTIGIVKGGQTPEDMPYVFLGVDKDSLLIGGQNSVWEWDAVRGGLHKVLDDTGVGYRFYSTMSLTTDAAGNQVRMFTRAWLAFTTDAVTIQYLKDEGGASDTHTLESNYFDGNLPGELKSLVGVTLMTSGIKSGETWTVSIEPDDGSFASAAVFNTAGAKTSYKDLAAAVTGYRFRYKIAWTATGDITAPSRVKGIVLHMVQGQMVTAWQLTIDGSEVLGIENDTVRPEAALGTLETLAGTQTLVPYVDEFRTTSTTHDVRVDSVQISRSAPQEIDEAVVVLTEQNLDN